MAVFTVETSYKIYEKLGEHNLKLAIQDEKDAIAMYSSWHRKTGIRAFAETVKDEKRHLAHLLEIWRKSRK